MTELKRWTRAPNYIGQTYYDHFVVIGQHRDSDSLTRSNFQVALKMLGGESEQVGVIRSTHWAVGWVEAIMVHESASKELLETAQEILESLEQYPVLDDDHWGQLEHDELYDYWENASLRERIGHCKHANVSIFAARHDDAPWRYDYLYDYLR